jgi:hypothetical protein
MKRPEQARSVWHIPGITESTDLESWRDWFVNAMIFFAVLGFPLSLLATIPLFIREKLYGLVALDAIFYLAVAVRLFKRGGSYKVRGYIWVAMLYVMMISFYVALGPHYARSAWLVMTVVMAALLFGVRAAAAAVIFN